MIAGIIKFNCYSCGTYIILEQTVNSFSQIYTQKDGLKIAAYLKKRNIKQTSVPVFICNNKRDVNPLYVGTNYLITIDEIIQDFPTIIQGQLDNALINLVSSSKYKGEELTIEYKKDYSLLYADSNAIETSKFILKQLIIDGYIENPQNDLIRSTHGVVISVTPKGWNKVAELESTNKNSKKVFVAMWFSDEMKEIFDDYIKPAVAESKEGHNALHIGKKEHNNEIIAEIKTSKFVIADLTGDRGGVYYEAGFAKGLGLPVIFTCHSDWFNTKIKEQITGKDSKDKEHTITREIHRKVHFDVSTINIIEWKTGEELKTKLINRIRATID